MFNFNSIAFAMVLFSYANLVSGQVPTDPIRQGKNIHTECGGNSSQQQCNQFLHDYLTYSKYVQDIENQSIALRKERYQQLERDLEIKTLPQLLNPQRFSLDRNARFYIPTRPRMIRFFIDQNGIPYHDSVNPSRVSLNTFTWELTENQNNSVSAFRRLALGISPNDRGIYALEGLKFSPALTADGIPVGALVSANVWEAEIGIHMEVVRAEPILFPNPNEPTNAWKEFKAKEASSGRQ